MSDIKLKPCPFCGSSAICVKSKGAYQIMCSDLDCCAKMGWYETEEEAIEAWNRRITVFQRRRME